MIELIRENQGAGLAVEGTAQELDQLCIMARAAMKNGDCEGTKIKNTVGAKIKFRFRLKGYKPEPDDIDDLLS